MPAAARDSIAEPAFSAACRKQAARKSEALSSDTCVFRHPRLQALRSPCLSGIREAKGIREAAASLRSTAAARLPQRGEAKGRFLRQGGQTAGQFPRELLATFAASLPGPALFICVARYFVLQN